jgi:hypothetical protein
MTAGTSQVQKHADRHAVLKLAKRKCLSPPLLVPDYLLAQVVIMGDGQATQNADRYPVTACVKCL